ncbi:MAG TPA: site-2 protease family protein [Candidatus Limnocylindrales bacterium]
MNSLAVAQAVIWIGMFLLISGPVHECAHAFTAWKLGDGTAKLFGRVSLDPFRHFDPVGGTLLIVSVMLNAVGGSPIGFGWAKPTPVNALNLRGRHADTMVAVAGPLSNLALAAVCAVGFRLLWASGAYPDNTSVANMVLLVFLVGIELNVVLMLFNLIPIQPLDGSHVLFDLLDPRTAHEVRNFMNQYGLILLVLVVLFAGQIVVPVLVPIVNFLAGVPILVN